MTRMLLLSAYREFEHRVGMLTLTRGSKSEIVLCTIRTFDLSFTIAEVLERRPRLASI